MTTRLNPYLNFDGTTREAMEFYKDVFGGELNIATFGESGAQNRPSRSRVMHAMLETPSGSTIMASDPPPSEGYEVQAGTNFSISLLGDEAAELRGSGRSSPRPAPCRCPSSARCGATTSAC